MSNMADAAAARREARRRKILENSHNRLQIISGKSNNECSKVSPIGTVIIPEPDYEIPATASTSIPGSILQENGVLFSQPELFEFLSPTHDIDASGDGEVTSDLASILHTTPSVVTTQEPVEVPVLSLWEKIIKYKYDIVLVSLFIQMLHGMSVITFDDGYYFLPVIIFIVTKLIWLPTQSNSSIAYILLMLTNGMSAARIRQLVYLTQCADIVFRHICIYLFTTICIQYMWITLRDSLVT